MIALRSRLGSAFVVVMAGAGSAACSDDDSGDAPARGLNDGQVADAVLTTNGGEVAQAETVEPMLSDAAVQAFAELSITEHSASNAELTALLQRRDIALESSPVSVALRQQSDVVVSQLQRAEPGAVDRNFVDAEVQAHDGFLAIIDQRLLPDVRDSELEAFLIDLHDEVEGRLEQARALQSSVSGTSDAP